MRVRISPGAIIVYTTSGSAAAKYASGSVLITAAMCARPTRSARSPISRFDARRALCRSSSTAATCVAATSSIIPIVPISAAARPIPRRSTPAPRSGSRFSSSGSPANGVKARSLSRSTERPPTAIRLAPIPRIAAVDLRLKPSVTSVVLVPTVSAIPPATKSGEAPDSNAGRPNRMISRPATQSARRARAPRRPATRTTRRASAIASSTMPPPRDRSATAYFAPSDSPPRSTSKTSSPFAYGMEPGTSSL